mmetsp:Transcript_18962/g.18631  ORF Transcript_18962/g.18631 Transcript_18962/m.18631 type:complete len:250 (+) Transcript_18962:559-1308(+)
MRDLIWNILTPNPHKRPSMGEIQEILEDWDRIDQITLNSDAKKIKAEYLRKMKGVTKTGKSAVPRIGDLSNDDIVKLQAKIRKEKDQKKSKVLVPFHQDYSSKMKKELYNKPSKNPAASVKQTQKNKKATNENKPKQSTFWDGFESHKESQPDKKIDRQPPAKQSPKDDFAWDFDQPSKSSKKSGDLFEDFGEPKQHSKNDFDFDFGSSPKKKESQDDWFEDFSPVKETQKLDSFFDFDEPDQSNEPSA